MTVFKRSSILLLLSSTNIVLSSFLGPRYPSPTDLTSNNSLVATSFANLTSTLNLYLRGNNLTNQSLAPIPGIQNVTFSFGVFSVHDPSAAKSLQYHYTSAEVASGAGTDKVDGDSIYRVASVSKLFTIFAGMLALNSSDWDRPITDFLPALLQYVDEDDPTKSVRWNEVTIAALGAQIAGIPRDAAPFLADIVLTAEDPTAIGLPPLNFSDPIIIPPCIEGLLTNPNETNPDVYCPGDLYATSMRGRAPTFPAWATPGYANNGFVLLGFALSKITGKSLDEMYRDNIFAPLDMASSNSTVPDPSVWSSRAVIAGDNPKINFAIENGFSKSSGGIFSTTNDLAKFGIGILNSTLLPANETRKWMKPVSHTASPYFSVGRPWEIYRYELPNHPGAFTDIYTKLGESGDYTSFVALLPDYDAGFSVASASTVQTRGAIVATITDYITQSVIPALEAQAAVEAERNFAGTYVASHGLNSSLSLSFSNGSATAGQPGLYISSWISNGTDMSLLLPRLLTGSSGYVRLFPSVISSSSNQSAFRASVVTMPNAEASSFSGPFMQQRITNFDWLTVDSPTYGQVGLSLFLFDLDDDRKAHAATPAAARAKLSRKN